MENIPGNLSKKLIVFCARMCSKWYLGILLFPVIILLMLIASLLFILATLINIARLYFNSYNLVCVDSTFLIKNPRSNQVIAEIDISAISDIHSIKANKFYLFLHNKDSYIIEVTDTEQFLTYLETNNMIVK